VCQLIIQSIKGINARCHVISVDEKSGIQALAREEQRAPYSQGLKKRKDQEYKRNGTTCLIAAHNVATGNIPNFMLNSTRTEEDFLRFTIETAKCFPKEDQLIFLADQLNTHKSESLVRWVAEHLKNMKTRQAFLEEETHTIRFVFTPKHCSWLNPIENWFAKLQKHTIKNGNFSSVKELEGKIEQYIEYYNKCLVKPLNWKFKGFNKDKPLVNFKVVRT